MVLYHMLVLDIAEIVGTLAFSLSGYFVGVKEKLDFLGIFITSFLTALGGGIIRDVIVGRAPLSFVDPTFPTIVLSVIIVATLLNLHHKTSLENKYYFILSDTLGLSSFAISGAIVANLYDFSIFGVMLLALITASGGGVLRDILINRVPLLLKSEFYGSVALLIGLILFILYKLSFSNFLTISIIFLFGVILRLVAYHRDWHLPKIKG